ncbi:MAG TPA: nucleotide exchange factor GrpE [Polyangiaceae bacterium]|nr:nucleotide exchange factor GrpE [Polyangiaceae bacterium]
MSDPSESPHPEPKNDDLGSADASDLGNSDLGSNAGNSAEKGDPSAPEITIESDPLAEAKAETARIRDQLIRTAADFDNYRKRTRREGVEAEQRGREAFLKEILPVFDNLERAVSHAEVATDIQSLLNGIQMVKRQFTDTLARQGIERVPTVGAQFDPAVHEAIQHLETNDQPPGTVAHEIQGGYIVQKKLIRPALVVVAKAKTQDETKQPTDSSESSAPVEGANAATSEGAVIFDEPEIVDDTDGEDNRD